MYQEFLLPQNRIDFFFCCQFDSEEQDGLSERKQTFASEAEGEEVSLATFVLKTASRNGSQVIDDLL